MAFILMHISEPLGGPDDNARAGPGEVQNPNRGLLGIKETNCSNTNLAASVRDL